MCGKFLVFCKQMGEKKQQGTCAIGMKYHSCKKKDPQFTTRTCSLLRVDWRIVDLLLVAQSCSCDRVDGDTSSGLDGENVH